MFNLALRISPVNGLGVGCRSRPLFGGLGASDFGKLCSLGNQGVRAETWSIVDWH